MKNQDYIKVRGARQHNLKNINVDIPKNKLIVFTGISGSGKSSLAFDTIYAEGQRRYVESLSSYARQFLGIMQKPDVDSIEGLSPAISIDQKTTSHNPRSTVGTVTEVYDYLRLLFARVGHPHCPVCGQEVQSQSVDQIVESVLTLIKEGVKKNKIFRFLVLSPVVRDKKGEFTSLFENLKAKGFRQVRIDNVVKDTKEDFVLIKTNKHAIEAVVDRVSIDAKNIKDEIFVNNLKSRLTNSFEQSLKLSDGLLVIAEIKDQGFELPEFPKNFLDHLYSERFSCPKDNISLPEIEPRSFSFNSPHGACPKCTGIGKVLKVVPELIFAPEISITEGGILPYANAFESDTWYSKVLMVFCQENGIDPKAPIKTLSDKQRKLILYGTGNRQYQIHGRNKFGKETHFWTSFEGVAKQVERRHQETQSDYARGSYERFMQEVDCEKCQGKRLNDRALSITIDAKNISEVTDLSIKDCVAWIKTLEKKLSEKEIKIAKLIIKEVVIRLNFLVSVGLDYLTIGRAAKTLAGGEAQRIRLASQIGTGLTGVLYILDEPTIGLHARDNKRLIETLKDLRDLGNTVVVVEHDREMIEAADHIIDFGPLAGKNGGAVVAQGTSKNIAKNKNSLTGKYLSGKKKIYINSDDMQKYLDASGNLFGKKEDGGDKKINIFGCSQFNLKNINVTFPIGKFITVTGVSGSGKSTLVVETLYHAIKQKLFPYYNTIPGKFKRVEGVKNIDKVILIDQSPIGRTPRSNPATYTKVFDEIRKVFANTKEAKANGFKMGRFSFNLKGGRCESCEGQGQNKIEMQFMADIWVTCEVCKGARYNAQTLEVEYKGRNISEVLNMSVSEALEFFHSHPKIVQKLETLTDVGLDYIELGQPAPTLSGGEAQRVKLASELSKRATGKTIYILDEPTTGLHFADLQKLLTVLKILVAKGNTVITIEHNLDVIKNSDWIIDLGPEGGEEGGHIVAQETVENIKKVKNSYTGQFLSKNSQ